MVDYSALGVLAFLIAGLLRLADKHLVDMSGSLRSIADTLTRVEKEDERRHGETSSALRNHAEQLDQITNTQKELLYRMNPPSANGGHGGVPRA